MKITVHIEEDEPEIDELNGVTDEEIRLLAIDVAYASYLRTVATVKGTDSIFRPTYYKYVGEAAALARQDLLDALEDGWEYFQALATDSQETLDGDEPTS